MTSLKDFIKGLILTVVPSRVLFYLKAIRYVRLVGAFSEVDEPELKVVKHLVKPGDTVVDVGANVGWYTNYLSKLVGARGKVISLEPMPETFALLSACVKAHDLENVELFNVGASEFDRSAVMEVPQYVSGGANYCMAHIVESGRQSAAALQREVKVRSLDSLLGEAVHEVRFIKCDVEGHELQLIKGAQETIRTGRAAWLIEVSRSSDPDLEGSGSAQIFGMLSAQGYSPWWLDRDVFRKRKRGDKALNYFFLLPSHISMLQEMASRSFRIHSVVERTGSLQLL